MIVLSNGSIGAPIEAGAWKAFFNETDYPINWKKVDPEDFEAAYAISVHKAQGSEFDEVFVVIPERRGLLSRELVYTAMTRSKGVSRFSCSEAIRENPLEVARSRSEMLKRLIVPC